jgi:hypothetical protein
MSHREDVTLSWAFICHACYRALDNERGMAEVGNKWFNLADAFCGDKGMIVNESEYQALQLRAAEKTALDG